MRITKICSILTALMIFTWIVSSNSFAQGTLAQPSVRLVYFLPSDRPARPDRIEALRQLIKDTQEFYADEMQRHGYGRQTFRVETDRSGEPIVHRFNGQFNERHYYERLTDFKVWDEFFQQVNDLQHVYLIAIDLSYELLNEGESGGLGGVVFSPANAGASFVFGSTAVRHRDITPREEVLGGSAIMPASGDIFYDTRGFLHPLRVITHELAHAFGLDHDFSTPDSAVGGRGFRFSECDTEWFSVSRFFNSAVSENASGNIQLISAPTYSAEGIALHFEVTDTDGLHQAQLLVPEDGSWGPWKLIGCQALDGQTQRVEFLSLELTSAPERVMLQFMDDLGNITWATFLVDIASLLPPPKVVSIPDPNLKQAIRSQLRLASGDTLTDQAMKKLESLNVDDRKIANIAGLEYATQLREVFMGRNQIKNYDRLAELPNLTTLYLWTNNISDLSVLPLLPKLELLDLNYNHIRDVSRLAAFTNLTTLMLRGNKISDVSPLTGLVNLEVLHLKGNPIQDTSVLASLTKLRDVDIDIHQQSVPATGTWLGIGKPSGLSPANFTIKPREFVILAHRDKRVGTSGTEYNDYFYFGKTDPQPNFPNLAQFFQNGGRIELISHITANPLPPHSSEAEFGDIVISEIMWGLDGTSPAKQYIELYNASAHAYSFADADVSLRFSTVSEEPLPDGAFPPLHNPEVRLKVIDRVSNNGWKVPGRSGNTSENKPLISMYRTIDYTTEDMPDGSLASSWKASTGRVNLPAPSFGTPGVKHLPPAPVVLVEASQRPPMYWIDAEAGTLHRLINAKVEDLLPSVQNATSLVVDMGGDKLYWTEISGNNRGRIKRANLDGSNVKLVKELTSVPLDLDLDTAAGKLYLTNAWGKIQRLNVDGSNFQSNLITGLEAPKHITLDVAGGQIYWIQQTSDTTGKIRSANLDGSNLRLVKDLTSSPRGLALDAVNKKLYLTNAYGKVQRLNLNGSNFQPNLITDLDAPEGVSVDVVGRKIYWTEQDGIWRADLNGENIEDVVTGLGAPTGIVLGTVPAVAPAAPAIADIPPNATVLLANYPNPFNPETWIPYELARDTDVKITIYNTQGVVVQTLTLGHQSAGYYTGRARAAYWDGRNTVGEPVASGLYFYTFTAGRFTATRKMLIRK